MFMTFGSHFVHLLKLSRLRPIYIDFYEEKSKYTLSAAFHPMQTFDRTKHGKGFSQMNIK